MTKIEFIIFFIIGVLVVSAAGAFKLVTKTHYGIEVGKTYKIEKIHIVDSGSFGITINKSLYFTKLHELHPTEDAKHDITEVFNTVDEMSVEIVKISGHDIFINLYLTKDNVKFSLKNWLVQQGLVYRN